LKFESPVTSIPASSTITNNPSHFLSQLNSVPLLYNTSAAGQQNEPFVSKNLEYFARHPRPHHVLEHHASATRRDSYSEEENEFDGDAAPLDLSAPKRHRGLEDDFSPERSSAFGPVNLRYESETSLYIYHQIL
jgi:hypothetical protein